MVHEAVGGGKKTVLWRIGVTDGGNQFKTPHRVLDDAAGGADPLLAPVNVPVRSAERGEARCAGGSAQGRQRPS
jgi:hypothetical protein